MIAAMERLANRPDVEDAIAAAAPSSEDDPWSDWHRLTAELADRERNGIIDPTDALARVASESRSAGDATGGVAVATIHKSKGLEWDAVVFAEATAKSLRDKPEDRRLAYVALTRARSRRRVVFHQSGGGLSRCLESVGGPSAVR